MTEFRQQHPYAYQVFNQLKDKIWRNLTLGAIQIPFYHEGSFMFNTNGTKCTGILVVIVFILSCLRLTTEYGLIDQLDEMTQEYF